MSISDISNGFGFLGGLGMFLYGMNIMADGLQKATGGKMKRMLGYITNNRFLGVLLGALITAIIQSSSATTVMLVGFVNSDFVNHRTEIGYWLLPEYQRQGIMTRSVRTLCRWAVEARLMHRIQIRCAVKNYSSNAIPRRLGFRLEGTERDGELMFSGEYVDTNVYSILDSEIISWSGKNI